MTSCANRAARAVLPTPPFPAPPGADSGLAQPSRAGLPAPSFGDKPEDIRRLASPDAADATNLRRAIVARLPSLVAARRGLELRARPEARRAHLVQRRAHPRGAPQHRGHSFARSRLAIGRQAACVEQYRISGLKPFGARVVSTALPVWMVRGNAHPGRHLALGQAFDPDGAAQVTKGLVGR